MKSSTKTILLWVVLIVLFTAFYQLFSNNPPRPEGNQDSSNVSWWVVLMVIAIVGVLVGYSRFQASRPWRKQYDAAMKAFGKGRFAEALELWTQSYEKTPWRPTVRFNIASARLNLWQLARSREDLMESLKLGEKAQQAALPYLVWVQVAFIDALEGKLADSRAATDKAGTSKDVTLNVPILTQAVLDVREGRLEQAQRSLRSSEMRQITGTLGELVRVLDAFCTFLATGEVRHVDKVALFQEAAPDELMRAWPELGAFLSKAPQT